MGFGLLFRIPREFCREENCVPLVKVSEDAIVYDGSTKNQHQSMISISHPNKFKLT